VTPAAIADQAAGDREFAKLVHRRKFALGRERDNAITSGVEIGIGGDQQCTDAVLGQRYQGGIQLGVVAGLRCEQPEVNRFRGLLDLL